MQQQQLLSVSIWGFTSTQCNKANQHYLEQKKWKSVQSRFLYNYYYYYYYSTKKWSTECVRALLVYQRTSIATTTTRTTKTTTTDAAAVTTTIILLLTPEWSTQYVRAKSLCVSSYLGGAVIGGLGGGNVDFDVWTTSRHVGRCPRTTTASITCFSLEGRRAIFASSEPICLEWAVAVLRSTTWGRWRRVFMSLQCIPRQLLVLMLQSRPLNRPCPRFFSARLDSRESDKCVDRWNVVSLWFGPAIVEHRRQRKAECGLFTVYCCTITPANLHSCLPSGTTNRPLLSSLPSTTLSPHALSLLPI